MSFIERLPQELLVDVAFHLPMGDLIKFLLASKNIHSKLSSGLWSALYRANFQAQPSLAQDWYASLKSNVATLRAIVNMAKADMDESVEHLEVAYRILCGAFLRHYPILRSKILDVHWLQNFTDIVTTCEDNKCKQFGFRIVAVLERSPTFAQYVNESRLTSTRNRAEDWEYEAILHNVTFAAIRMHHGLMQFRHALDCRISRHPSKWYCSLPNISRGPLSIMDTWIMTLSLQFRQHGPSEQHFHFEGDALRDESLSGKIITDGTRTVRRIYAPETAKRKWKVMGKVEFVSDTGISCWHFTLTQERETVQCRGVQLVADCTPVVGTRSLLWNEEEGSLGLFSLWPHVRCEIPRAKAPLAWGEEVRNPIFDSLF